MEHIDTVRVITDHIVSPETDTLEVMALGAPPNHLYQIAGFDLTSHPNFRFDYDLSDAGRLTILFQNGPIPKVGVNGITNEALLAIVIDRLRGFQSGPFACSENQQAMLSTEAALYWLQKRTRNRMQRGIEGTYTA